MKVHEFERLAPIQRRRFLKLMGAALAAPLVPAAVRYACNDIVGEAKAEESGLPTYFIEIDLRDQWDFGHVFVPPGLATYANLRRGEYGRKCALFYEMNQLVQKPNNVYLTPESMALEPPSQTVVVMVTPDQVLVQGEPVATIAEVDAQQDLVIQPLQAALKSQSDRILRASAQASIEDREITVLGDKSVPYRVLKKVLATCTAADYGKLSLAVVQKEEALQMAAEAGG